MDVIQETGSISKNVARVCRKCGQKIFADAPQGVCAICVLKMGLGSFATDHDGEGDLSETPVLMEFGDYDIVEEIGRGGQGVVYRARQKSLNRTVALKVIGMGHWASTPHLKRFRQEAEAAARLDHPQIVPIYEIGERDGSCYFSMKFVEGGQLDEMMRRKPLSIRQAAELLVKISRTVQFAHEHGILHRDIKPGNILLDKKGEPHLTDFGLARLVENNSTVTNSFDVLGTPSYMSPEQASGQAKESDVTTDVYALGAVFYQMLTGQPPFAGGTTYETIRLVMETEPRHPRLWNSKIDLDLATICLKCLEKNPPKRYPSAEALARDIERWLRHEPIQARPANIFNRGRKWIRRNPTKAVLVPSLAAIAVLAFTTFWNREPPPSPASVAVLPFANLSNDKDGSILADGIQDDVLTKLAKIADLKVISRTSVMHYRGEQNMRKIGSALRVSHVVEGSLRGDGRRWHINAQLIDARNDQHIWAENYDVDAGDLFAIQTEIAQKIGRALESKISSSEKAAIEAQPTRNLEAYKLYLQAKALVESSSSVSPEMIDKSERAGELLEQAVTRDPNFALAHCLLVRINLNLYWVTGRSETPRRDRAGTALREAQRLAPDAGETHLAQAAFDHYARRDYNRALEEFDMARRLLPNSADVLFTEALLERRLGRWNDALRHFSKASELNPEDPSGLYQVILTCNMLGQTAEADRKADRAIAVFPDAADQFWNEKVAAALSEGNVERARAALAHIKGDFPEPRFFVAYLGHDFAEAERLSLTVWQGKDADKARWFAFFSALAARGAGATDRMRSYLWAAAQSYEPLMSGEPDPGNLSLSGVIDAGLGRREAALEKCRRAVELVPVSFDAVEAREYGKNLALAYAWLGERDLAIEQLSTLAGVPHGVPYGELKLDPAWDTLRDDPRFAQIVADAAKPIVLK